MTDVGDPSRTQLAMRSVTRVCDLLDALRYRRGGLSLDTLAEAAGLPRSSAYRYLLTLERRGYVLRDPPTGTFRWRSVPSVILPKHVCVRAAAELPAVAAAAGVRWPVQLVIGLLVPPAPGLRLAEARSPSPGGVTCRLLDARSAPCSALGRAALVSLPVEQMEAVLDAVPHTAAATDRLTAARMTGRVTESDPDGRTRLAVPLPGLPLGAGLQLTIADAAMLPEVNRVAHSLAESCASAIRRSWPADGH